MSDKQGRGGARPGSGRPRGAIDESTKLRIAAEKQLKDNVARVADRLLSAQLSVALGEQSLYVISYTGKGKDKKKRVDRVTDPETIVKWLKGELDESSSEEYYYLSTKPPSTRAIDSLFNRVFGKPQESVDLTSGGKPLPRPIMGGTSVPVDNSVQKDMQS